MLYAIGDVLLLASKAALDDYPKLKPFAKLLSDAEKMVVLSPNRMIWGALLGVFATPLGAGWLLADLQRIEWSKCITRAWQQDFCLRIASIIGAFVHGTFYFMGEYIQALNKVEDGSQSVIVDMIARHRKVLIITYAPVLILIIIASILFSILVASGKTAFPVWMAAVNPVTMTIAWLVLKRILPQSVRDWTEGAGFQHRLPGFLCVHDNNTLEWIKKRKNGTNPHHLHSGLPEKYLRTD